MFNIFISSLWFRITPLNTQCLKKSAESGKHSASLTNNCNKLIFISFIDATQPMESEDLCDDILCSNVYDPVCGEAIALNGARRVHKFHNICYLRLAQCKFSYAG